MAALFALTTLGLVLSLPAETELATAPSGGSILATDSAVDSATVSTPGPATSDDVPPPTVPPADTTTASSPPPTVASVAEGVVADVGDYADPALLVELAFVSEVPDVTAAELAGFALATLNDPRSWGQAGFRFAANPDSALRVVLAEGPRVDALCLPLRTASAVSCQNGPVVALNATRWREATTDWDATVDEYRRYLVNHEVGHLIGQRHPTPRCPVPGAPAAVMEQQTKGLEGCRGNAWPRSWEIEYAAARPAKVGPLPSWAPDPVPANLERPG